jgi:hypothetical protein
VQQVQRSPYDGKSCMLNCLDVALWPSTLAEERRSGTCLIGRLTALLPDWQSPQMSSLSAAVGLPCEALSQRPLFGPRGRTLHRRRRVHRRKRQILSDLYRLLSIGKLVDTVAGRRTHGALLLLDV